MNMLQKNWVLLIISAAILLTSCTDDLNTEPEIEQTLSDVLRDDPDAIKGLLAKLYGGLVLHGIGVPGSDNQQADILGDDPGETVYLRSLWNMQEITTDILKNRWGDGGLDPLTTASGWVATNKFFGYMYNRIYFQVGQINNFLLETESIDFDAKEVIRAEARFIRALAYYHGMDLFGGLPIVTDADGIGGALKPRATRTELFNHIEEELLAIRDILPRTNEYGRANKAAVDMVLAKIYLNAEIYTGVAMYTEALASCTDIMTSGVFSLDTNYQSIFQGDNFNSKEIIFPIIGDRNVTQSFGGTTYLVNGSYSTETMDINSFGAQDSWTGHRCTPALYGLFGTLDANSTDTSLTSADKRAIFHSKGHDFEMLDYRVWTHGYPTTKFRNTYAQGTAPIMNFSDIDFPLFRLADVYLMYAEAHLRGGGGDANTALDLINQLRERAYGTIAGNITATDLTLDFIIDERARELYYEAHRRQDLIRFGRFTGGIYKWPWKGGVEKGTTIPSNYKLFPIPLEALQANPNLQQNTGY